jgi:two-component system, NtrC family, nitrogen regulation sensor histidine kinase GlnL
VSEPAPSSLAERAAETAPAALILIDSQGGILFVNSAAEGVLDRSRRRLIGVSLAETGPWGEAAWAMAEKAMAEQRDVLAHDLPVDTPSGGRRATVDAAPEGEGACICIRPWPEGGATPRGDQAANAAKGFGRMLSHELKNPMAGARGAAQLILSSEDGEAVELARVIVAELDRAVRIADRWSRIGDLAPQPFEPVNLHALAHDAVRSARAAAGEVVCFTESYDPSIPEAFADPDLVTQALLNLLLNAAEAVKREGGGAVDIATRYRSARPGGTAPEARLEVVVSDDGPGVPPELGDAIFNPFVTGKPAGEGLGLALVSRIADLHGGGVEYDSRPGRTAFHFYLKDAGGRRG